MIIKKYWKKISGWKVGAKYLYKTVRLIPRGTYFVNFYTFFHFCFTIARYLFWDKAAFEAFLQRELKMTMVAENRDVPRMGRSARKRASRAKAKREAAMNLAAGGDATTNTMINERTDELQLDVTTEIIQEPESFKEQQDADLKDEDEWSAMYNETGLNTTAEYTEKPKKKTVKGAKKRHSNSKAATSGETTEGPTNMKKKTKDELAKARKQKQHQKERKNLNISKKQQKMITLNDAQKKKMGDKNELNKCNRK